MKKVNKKFDRTDGKIINTFLTMINADSKRKITINDVAKKAKISRPTLYAHFKTINDIYLGINKLVINKLSTILDTDQLFFQDNIDFYLKNVTKLIKQSFLFIKNLCKTGYVWEIVHTVSTIVANKIYKSPKYAKFFMNSTFSGVMADWLDIYSTSSALFNAWAVLLRRGYKDIDEDFVNAWASDFCSKIFKNYWKMINPDFKEKHYLDEYYQKVSKKNK